MASEKTTPPAKRGRKDSATGVHRVRRSRWWAKALAGLGIFVLSASATFGVLYARAKADDISWLAWLSASEPTPSASPSAFVTLSPTPTVSPSPSVTEDPPDYRFSTGIRVYNDSGISGLAGQVRDAIGAYVHEPNEETFTKISTANWPGASPPANVIRYNDEKYRDTVDLLSEILGISTVAFGITESDPIEIVLVEDPLPEPEPSPSPSPSPSTSWPHL